MGKIILRLDRVMADRKISLKELSERVGVSNVNLSKMKTGRISAIRFSTLELSARRYPASRATYWSTIRPSKATGKRTNAAQQKSTCL